MIKSKTRGSNALAESADISQKSTQKEDVEAGADHDSPRMGPRTRAAEEERTDTEDTHDGTSAAETNGDSDASASTSNSHNEDPDEPTPKRATPSALRKTRKNTHCRRGTDVSGRCSVDRTRRST